VPTNGLAIFCGIVSAPGGREKRELITLEPLKPIRRSLYLCDKRFHAEVLREQLDDGEVFGFIIIDGHGVLFGRVQGSSRHVLHKFSVELPKKHSRGGQSALRFARLRLEKRLNYIRKVAELSASWFLKNNLPLVRGLVVGGCALLKHDLVTDKMFPPPLRNLIVSEVDLSYGGQRGFHDAIILAADALAGVRLVQERELLRQFYQEIAMESGMVCYSASDTMAALELGAVRTLIVWDELPLLRVRKLDPTTRTESVAICNPDQVHCKASSQDVENQSVEEARDKSSGSQPRLEVVEVTPLCEYLAEHFRKWGVSGLEFVSSATPEGSQFCRGFGGIGGVLSWDAQKAIEDMVDGTETESG